MSRLYRAVVRRMMSCNYSWPIMLNGKCIANEVAIEPVLSRGMPRHEAGDMIRRLTVFDQPVIIQLVARRDHRWLRRTQQSIIGPEDRADKANPLDDQCPSVQQMDASLVCDSLGPFEF